MTSQNSIKSDSPERRDGKKLKKIGKLKSRQVKKMKNIYGAIPISDKHYSLSTGFKGDFNDKNKKFETMNLEDNSRPVSQVSFNDNN